MAVSNSMGSVPSNSATLTVNAASSCLNSSATTWTNTSFPAQAAQFTATYDATPNQNNMDGVVSFSFNAATGYTSLAVITRFASTGMIDARNAGAYSAAVPVPYTAGLTYHFRLLINPTTKTYTVYVTPPGGTELELATNYAFRSEQSTVSSLNDWSLSADSGSHSVCNMTIGSGSTAAPPTISTQPASQTITAGKTATFTVVAGGTAPLGYQWQKNGANFAGATSASYTTLATTTADSGSTFAVVVTNTAGTVTSAAATLTVNPAPVTPTITTQPANQTVTAGQTATFTVVAGGTAPLTYQWQKNGTNFAGATSASYTTLATTTVDSGSTFAVVVTNTAGTVNSAAATLTVQTNSTFSISGTITPAAGGSGATVTLSGAANATTTANGSGNYSFTGLANGSYTVTPSKSGFTFTPASANATVNGANVTGVNFTAVAPTFTVSGTITPTAGGSGATVTLSGAANASTTTDGSGNYTFTSVSNGSYTLTPSNSGYTFTPASQPVTVNGANVTGVNFTAQVAVQAAAGAPVLFFSDLTSGPATGNSDTTYSTNGGVYVTLYGNFFGAVQGTSSVSLNGGSCLKVVSWGTPWLWYQKIVVQLTSSCASGNFTVTTSLGTSNGLSFAVRSGNIHFISGSGSDSASGSFTAPWRTINHAASTMAAGDTSYAQTGSDDTTDDGSGWSTSLLINSSGSASAPISLVAYPGASVTIGSSSVSNSIRSGRTIPTNYWNVAGFTLVGGGSVLASWGSNYWRMVGNDMSCPNGNGAGGCYVPIETTFLYTYGNNIHNTGVSGASAEYHAVYLATDSNDQDFGWNEIAFVNGGRGLQTHSAPNGGGTLGYSLFNMSIHDNIIHDTDLDCIVADTLSPNAGGPVTIYNNVFYNCGTTTPPEGTGGWSGINIPGYTEAGPTSAGTVEIFNNTFYAYGLNTNPPYGGQENGIVWNGSGSSMSVHVRNNLLYSVTTSVFPSGVPYFAPSGSAQIYGVNNLVFGAGTSSGNSSITNSVSANPLLTNVTGFNFLPLTGSPAIGAGSPITGLTPFGINNIGRDINGNPRPATPSIGAYE